MSSLAVRVWYEQIRIIDAATFTGSYLPIGGPFEHNPFLIKMVNASNVSVLVSIDGVTDMDICPAGCFFLYDETSNSSREGGLTMAKMTQVYVKGAVGIGDVYLVVQYAGDQP